MYFSTTPHPVRPPTAQAGFALWLLLVALLSAAPLPVQAQGTGSDRCLNFAGNGQHVFVPHGPELNSFPFTVAFWLKTTQTDPFVGLTTKYLTGSGNGWDVHLNNGYIRTYYFKSWSDRLWTGDTFLDRPNGGFVADGRWHHIAYSVDTQAGTLYVDGQVRDRLSWAGSPGAPTHPMELILGGTRVDKTTDIDGHFVGQLDEIAIWGSALDADSVARVMAGRPIPVVPVLRFDCDGPTGTVLTNRAYTGARFNGALRGIVPPQFVAVAPDERPALPLLFNGGFESGSLSPWIAWPSGQVVNRIFSGAAQGSAFLLTTGVSIDGYLRQRFHVEDAGREWRLRFAYAVGTTNAPAGSLHLSVGGQPLEPVQLPGGARNPYRWGYAGWAYAERTFVLPSGPADLEVIIPPELSGHLQLDDFQIVPASEQRTARIGFAQESFRLREEGAFAQSIRLIREGGNLEDALYATLELRTGSASVEGTSPDVRGNGSPLPNRFPIRFAPGQPELDVWLFAPEDRTEEGTETITLNIVQAENAGVTRAEATVFIEDEPLVASIEHPAVLPEGASGVITLRLERGAPVSVRLRAAPSGTATAGSDFVPFEQTLSLGTNAVSVPISILQDPDAEGRESIRFEMQVLDRATTLAIVSRESDEEPVLWIEDDERTQLVQRIQISPGAVNGWWSWDQASATADSIHQDGQEILRIPLEDGSLLFLDADAQPLTTLGNGTGRLTPGSNGIPQQVLRMFPDGHFIGRTENESVAWIRRYLPDGSPDPGFSPILHLEGGISISRSGEIWILDFAGPDSPKWALHDRNGRRVPGSAQPPLDYGIVGIDASGRTYFSATPQGWEVPSNPPSGRLVMRTLPDGTVDPSYDPHPPLPASATFIEVGPLSPSGLLAVVVGTYDGATGDQSITILEISPDGDSIKTVANRPKGAFQRLLRSPSGELVGESRTCWPGGWFGGGCWTYYESIVTDSTLDGRPALLPSRASERSGPLWATSMRPGVDPQRDRPPHALLTLTPPWYRELRPSPVPEAGFSDTGLFLRESALAIPVLRAGSPRDPATVRGRVLPRSRGSWNETNAIPFEATFAAGASDAAIDLSFLARDGVQPLREFLVRLDSGSGIDISPFHTCRIRIVDDAQLPAAGQLRLVTGTGRDEPDTAFLIGRWQTGPSLLQASSLRPQAWGDPGGEAASQLLQIDDADVWVLPVPTTGSSGWFRIP